MQVHYGVLFLIFTSCAWAKQIEVFEPYFQATYGYLQKYGIPRAAQIRKAEEKFSTTRIVNGLPAGMGQYPFKTGLIGDVIGLDYQTVCGGTLLTPMRVVTAAHCWSDGINQVWRFTVVLGSIYIFSGGTRVQTSAVASHPDWSAILARHDIAVVYLPSAVMLSDVIGTVTLPNFEEDQDFAGDTAIAVGFGITADDETITPEQFLSHVRLNVMSNSICKLAYPLFVQPSHVCTSGVGGYGPCSGDSGGPLLLTRNGSQVLIGITSFVSGLGCESNLPAVYSRVTSYFDFIHSHIK